MALTLSQQAAQAQQQGQQLLDSDNAQAAQSKTDYTNYSNQATQANQNLQSQAAYMQGEGSGQSVYNANEANQMKLAGYNSDQQADAEKSLYSLTGAFNGANSQFNTAGGVGAYGVGAGALAGYESSILQPLQTGVANANTMVGQGNTAFANAANATAQLTTNQVQGEQATVTALTNAVQNYQSQAAAALNNMQFYSQLTSTQGGLNATEQQSYAQAEQAYASAQQAIAQSKLLIATTTGQNLTNQAAQNQLNAPKVAAPVKNSSSITLQAPSNSGIKLQGGNSNIQGSSIPLQGGGSNLQGSSIRLQ
jgi:hypothetical protein